MAIALLQGLLNAGRSTDEVAEINGSRRLSSEDREDTGENRCLGRVIEDHFGCATCGWAEARNTPITTIARQFIMAHHYATRHYHFSRTNRPFAGSDEPRRGGRATLAAGA